MAKRKLTEDLQDAIEFEGISDLNESEVATVHAMVGSVSPMKGDKKLYFNAVLSDGDKNAKLVGFSKYQRDELKQFEENEKPVSINKCKVQRGLYTDKLEVKMRSSSVLCPSPKKFKVDPSTFKPKNITLKEVATLNKYDRVSVNAKVVKLYEKALVSEDLWNQEVHIADKGTAAKLSIFGNHIGTLKLGKTYSFNNIFVNSYLDSNKYLQIPKEGAEIVEIEDFTEVAEDDIPEDFQTISGTEVAGVVSLECFIACIACKGKVATSSDQIGSCSKCGMTQRLNHCSQTVRAKLLLTIPGGSYITLNAFGKQVTEIAETDEPTRDNLIAAKPFTVTYKSHVINTVSRPQ